MQITRQADYAVRAVLYLADNPEQRVSTGKIAEEQKIPPAFLTKIIAQLSIAGFLQTFRGAKGGVSLAKSPMEISLLEVVETIDGPIYLNECVAGDGGACSFSGECPFHDVWCDAQVELVARLRNTNFDQLKNLQ